MQGWAGLLQLNGCAGVWHSVRVTCPVTLATWAKMPRFWSTNRALRSVKLFNLTGISMFIIIINYLSTFPHPIFVFSLRNSLRIPLRIHYELSRIPWTLRIHLSSDFHYPVKFISSDFHDPFSFDIQMKECWERTHLRACAHTSCFVSRCTWGK